MRASSSQTAIGSLRLKKTSKAIEEIAKAPVRELIVTDTVPLPKEKQHHPKIVRVSLAPLLARAVESVFQRTSTSCLFE